MIRNILISVNFNIDSNPRRKQVFSNTLVEPKRSNRSLPVVINGLLASESRSRTGEPSGNENSNSDHESLFITGDPDDENMIDSTAVEISNAKNVPLHQMSKLNPSANPFNPTPVINGNSAINSTTHENAGSFGRPTPIVSMTPTLGKSTSATTVDTPSLSNSTSQAQQPPKFNFFPSETTIPMTSDSSAPLATATTPLINLPTSSSNPTPQPKKSLFHSSSIFSPDPTKFSFATSPLFEAANAKNDSKVAEVSTSKSLFPSLENAKNFDLSPQLPLKVTTPIASSSALFPSSLSVPKLPETSTAATPKISSQLFPATVQTTQATPPTNIKPIPPSFASLSKSGPKEEASKALKPIPAHELIAASNVGSSSDSTNLTLQEPIPSKSTTTASNSLNPAPSRFVPSLSPAQQAKVSPPEPDPRPAVLDSLANSMMLDDAGLLEQFLEYTLGPIIQESFYQVDDERSWETAR